MQHLARLEYPIVCDLLRALSPIPAVEIPAALLSETDEAYTIALEVLDQDKRRYLAEGIETIAERITCLLYTSPSPRDQRGSRMPSSA